MFPFKAAYQAFTVSGDSGDESTLRRGLRWLGDAQTPGGTGILLLPGKDNMSGSALEPLLGSATIKSLLAGKPVRLGSRSVLFATNRTVRTISWSGGPVLAVWTDDETLDQLHTRVGITAICAIAWLPKDIARWTRAMSPVDLAAGTAAPPVAPALDPTVVAALLSVTARTNLSTGLANRSDREAAVEAFRILAAAGYEYDPEEIRAWALQNGWRPDGANELADVSGKVLAGRTVRTRPITYWVPDVLAKWQASARGELNPQSR